MQDKFIFLDVDGVINPLINIRIKKQRGEPTSSYHIQLPGDKLYRLKRIVDNTGAKIILSSSWRIGFDRGTMTPSPSVINLSSQLQRYGMTISGFTPLQYDRHRGTEISIWLARFQKQFGYMPKYIIIDDELCDIIDTHRGHCVKTTSLLGLQDEHVNIAINLLNN